MRRSATGRAAPRSRPCGWPIRRCSSATYEDVHRQTLDYVRGLTPADLDRVVDEAWDPPVTLGVRLVSVLDDDIQHAGQAAFVRGVLERRRG